MTARFILRLRKWDWHRQEVESGATLPIVFVQITTQTDRDSCDLESDTSTTQLHTRKPIPLDDTSSQGSSWDPIAPITLKELGGDLGPTPSDNDTDSIWFSEYEWEWERMDPKDVEEMRKRALIGQEVQWGPDFRLSKGGMSVPRDGENALWVRDTMADHLAASAKGASV